jgi:hypothetical protein
MRARLLAALLVLGLGACTPTPTPTATPAPTTSKFAAAQARPTSSASPRHRCPMWVPRIDHMAPSPRLTARPADVRVCVVNEPPSKRPIPDGVTLDGRSAANLARLVHAMPVGGVPAQCSRRRPFVVLRFDASVGATVDVPVEYPGCPVAAVFVDGVARRAAIPVASLLLDIAASRQHHGAAVPNLVGMPLGRAQRVARLSGHVVQQALHVLDPRGPTGTVLLQAPAPGDRGRRITVLVSARPVRRCEVASLTLDYLAGGADMGDDFGDIVIRTAGSLPCTLIGPITVIGLDAAGRADTTTVHFRTAPAFVLTPHPATVPHGQPEPVGTVVGDLGVFAEYRDDPTSRDGLCERHRVIPTTWLVTFTDGRQLTVANQDDQVGEPALLTCFGRLQGAGTVR